MDISLDYIRRKFQEFNQFCFEGKLQPLPFKISRARTFLGQVRCKREAQPDNSWRYFDFEFVVSEHTHVMEKESEIEDVILHEMIHYYILSNQIQDNGPHGDVFKQMMRQLNMKFNRNISVRHKASTEEHDRDTEKRQHLICVTRFRTNKMGITISTRSRLFQLWDELKLIPNIAEQSWYSSTDPFFNRFPRATTAKFYAITRAELEEHFASAHRLVRSGDTIKIIKK